MCVRARQWQAHIRGGAPGETAAKQKEEREEELEGGGEGDVML